MHICFQTMACPDTQRCEANARSTKQARCSWCGPCHKGSAGGAPRRSPALQVRLAAIESRPVQISSPRAPDPAAGDATREREADRHRALLWQDEAGEKAGETAGPAERKDRGAWVEAEGKRGRGAKAGCRQGLEDPPGVIAGKVREWGAPVTCIV